MLAMCLEEDPPRHNVPSGEGAEAIVVHEEGDQNPHGVPDDPGEDGVVHIGLTQTHAESGSDCYPYCP